MTRGSLVRMAAMALVPVLQSCGHPPIHYPYRPAMYEPTAGVSQELEVYPLAGKAFRVPLPLPAKDVERIVYSPDGETLYAGRLLSTEELLHPVVPLRPSLFKIEFNPTRLSPVPGSEKLLAIYTFEVLPRRNTLIIAGMERGKEVPGIIALNLATGDIQTIVENFPTNYKYVYNTYLSVSPDGARATAMDGYEPKLIDLTNGKVGDLEGDFQRASWSPDGKWLAALKGGKTVLLDALTLEQRRAFGATELIRSADSRFLLNKKIGWGLDQLVCALSEFGTLEMIDINTGRRTEVESSRCHINRNTLGWVSADVFNTR